MVFWVFGCDPLIWCPGFDYDEKIMGYIKDYRRVFNLGHEDDYVMELTGEVRRVLGKVEKKFIGSVNVSMSANMPTIQLQLLAAQTGSHNHVVSQSVFRLEGATMREAMDELARFMGT